MCTTDELIEFLKQFPKGTEIKVLKEYSRSWNNGVEWTPLDLSEYSDAWCYVEDHNTLYLGDA